MRTPSKTQLTYTPLGGKPAEILDRMFQREGCMIEINPGHVVLPEMFKSIGQDILDLQIVESDVWMCSFPRTGSTWAQEMVWLIGHDLDFERAAKTLQQIRCPLIELSCILAEGHSAWHSEALKGTSVDLVKYMPHPRYVRCHLPWELLPRDILNNDGSVKPKIIYTARNPKDMCVSYYHYFTLVHHMEGTFEDFCELYLQGRVPFGPAWNNILGFWERRHDPNILFIKFEEMKKNLPAVIRRTADFLNKKLSDEQVERLTEHLSFKNMKTNKAVNLEPIIEKTYGKEYLDQTNLRFIRKGEIGDWKNFMTPEIAKRFDDWAAENTKGTDLTFE